MKLFIALCVLAVVCSTFGAPDVENRALLVSSGRGIDLIGDARKLIEDLAENLLKSAQEALDAVANFNAGIIEEAKVVRDKIIEDIQKFRNRVTEAVDNVMHRISNTSGAVKECVDSHRSAAASVFNNTMSSTLSCVDERISDISKEIKHLVTMATDAKAAGSQAMEDMRKCTNGSTLLAVGTCLGGVAMHTELKSVGFLSQSTMAIGRINIGISTLPAALQVCAGVRLVQTGMETGKVIVDIGSCSATGIFNTILGKPTQAE